MPTPLYDISTNPMLTKEAAALATSNLPLFQSHEMLAETLLGVNLPLYTDPRALDQIGLALAMQVNFQVKQGLDAMILSSSTSTHTKQTDVYRARWVDPRALAIATHVAGRFGVVEIDVFRGCTSVRARST